MIGQLKGIIDRIENDHAIIDVGGVGYVVFCSAKTRDRLGAIGSATKLQIETHVREDQITLFGFANSEEKRWFKLLQNVQGVGAKVALAILSAFEPAEITNVILAQDKAAFKPVAGIGPKLALRIVSELKDSAKKIAGDFTVSNNKNERTATENSSKILADAISALENLGYKRIAIYPIIHQQTTQNPDITLETLITNSLRLISKK